MSLIDCLTFYNYEILTDNLPTFYKCRYLVRNRIRERYTLPAKLVSNYAVHAVVQGAVGSISIRDRAIHPKTINRVISRNNSLAVLLSPVISWNKLDIFIRAVFQNTLQFFISKICI